MGVGWFIPYNVTFFWSVEAAFLHSPIPPVGQLKLFCFARRINAILCSLVAGKFGYVAVVVVVLDHICEG